MRYCRNFFDATETTPKTIIYLPMRVAEKRVNIETI
jgi:hypothetical protein